MNLIKKQGPAKESHQGIIEKFQSDLLEKNSLGGIRDKGEIKKLEVTHFEGRSETYLSITVGQPGDEGSLAEVYCRDHRLIQIGSKGGVKILNTKNKSKSKTRGWFNALHAITDH